MDRRGLKVIVGDDEWVGGWMDGVERFHCGIIQIQSITGVSFAAQVITD